MTNGKQQESLASATSGSASTCLLDANHDASADAHHDSSQAHNGVFTLAEKLAFLAGATGLPEVDITKADGTPLEPATLYATVKAFMRQVLLREQVVVQRAMARAINDHMLYGTQETYRLLPANVTRQRSAYSSIDIEVDGGLPCIKGWQAGKTAWLKDAINRVQPIRVTSLITQLALE